MATTAPSLDQIRKVNAESEFNSTENPVGVFVGGTNGVGEATAYEWVKHNKGPVTYIIGRNEEAGNRVVEKLKELTKESEGKQYFIKADISLIKECDRVVEQIKKNESKVNLMFLSAGFLTMNGRTESPEGLDTKLSVNYYGRWRIVQQLMPLVEKAVAKKENTRVISVLDPNNMGPLNMDDLELKNNFTLFNANRHISMFNSLAVKRFGELYPDVAFVHAFPGAVNTGILRELPWYIRKPAAILTHTPLGDLLLTSAQTSGQKFNYLGWSSPEYAKGWHITDSKLVDTKSKAEEKGYLPKELCDTVWSHTEAKFDEIVPN